MSKDYKRILITLRCDICGRELEHDNLVVLQGSRALCYGGCDMQHGDSVMTRLSKAVHIGYHAATPACPVPPPGWRCTRVAGHEGPCAAVPA